MKTSLLKLLQTASLSIAAALSFAASNHEILVTTMDSGGENGIGVIYSINPDGTQGAIAVTFNGTNGAKPSGNLIQDGEYFYGTTSEGGINNNGVLFRYNTTTNAYGVVHHFNGADGWGPRNIHLQNNTIYGTTFAGGTHTSAESVYGMGVLYSYDISSGLFNKLIDFEGTNGENPQGVIYGIDNNLYGLTRQGGEYGVGVLYRFNPVTYIYTKLHSFNDVDGSLPTNCKLIQASNNILYGTTTWGGNNDMGVLFRFDMAHDMYTVLHHFDEATGRFPEGVLTELNGVLYGITPYGGANGEGVVYSYNIATATYSIIHTFADADGRTPASGLTLGADGNLYGLTTYGGAYGKGVIFSINPTTNTYLVLADNTDATGTNPLSPFLELADNTTTGINETDNNVSVFPNPTANTINFNITGYNATSIAISDINGSKVLESSFTPQLDISSLAAGTYFVQLNSTDANSIRTRIVKQ